MSNRISGDFSYETMEAFRAAYAQQLATPEEDSIANNSGLPTSTISNTSPWFDGVGLWKYPSGKGPDQDLKTPFDPNNYFTSEITEGEEESEFDGLSDEELQTLIDSVLEEDESEPDQG